MKNIDTAQPLETILPELVRSARNAENARLSRHGMTIPQFFALVVLENQDGNMMKELGEHLGLSLGTVTGIVDRLARNGLVARYSDGSDRRVVRVRLTPAGQSVLKKVRRERDKVLAMAIEGISREDLVIFFDVLKKIIGRMQEWPRVVGK